MQAGAAELLYLPPGLQSPKWEVIYLVDTSGKKRKYFN